MPRYRAVAPIYVGWAMAYAVGHEVPYHAIDAHPEWAEFVEEIPEPTAEPPAAVFTEPTPDAETPPTRKTASTKG